MTRRVAGSVILAAAVLAGFLSACSSTPPPSTPDTQPAAPVASASQGAGNFTAWPARVYSPYFETWVDSSLPALASQSGARYFNLGFLQASSAGSCTLTWDGSQSADSAAYQSEIGQLKQQGGNVALTFGTLAGRRQHDRGRL